ncbi:hypothetical protein BDZ91DRAFT_714251 [Kalaharituber pfeilii]|nr:hypothetical protein BDZ91DRAFT_714251 [Kalaharituber pfeilii]
MKSLWAYATFASSLAIQTANAIYFVPGPVIPGGLDQWKPVGKPNADAAAKFRRQESSVVTTTETTGTDTLSSAVSATETGTTEATQTATSTGTTTDTEASVSTTETGTVTETGSSTDFETSTRVTTTATGPSPWISLGPEGSPVTITPVVTTNADGMTTTLDSAPSGATLVDHDKDDSTHRVNFQCSAANYQKDSNGVAKWKPFCMPHNGTTWRVDEKGGSGIYYVTWNTEEFDPKEKLYITLLYYNRTEEDGAEGIWSEKLDAGLGGTDVSPQSKWLEDAKDETAVVYFHLQSASGKFDGPMIEVTTKPPPPPVDTTRPPVSNFGLTIGIPVIVVFVIGMLLGTHFCMREQRKIGPIRIGGVRGRGGYGVGRSRRQRLKGSSAAPFKHDDVPITPDTPIPHRNSGADWELTDVQGGRARGYDDDATVYRDDPRVIH